MNILITGSTGFLGSTLAKRLLKENHHVYLVARSKKKAQALIEELDHKNGQVHVIEGELTRSSLGINEEEIAALTGNIDVIYHSAALLSFDESMREEIFHVNVSGTKNILEFAKQINVQKFIHVSTAYTLGTRSIGSETLYPTSSTFQNAYEESKCNAEHLVMSYHQDFDVMIMRPAIIIGDSETGESNSTFGLYGIIRTVEILKKLARRDPNTNHNYRILMNKRSVSNLVPIDYVVTVLMLGLDFGENNTIYHITNPNPPSNQLIFDSIMESLEFNGVELTPYDEEHVLTEEEVKINTPIKVFKEYLNSSITFVDENTRNLLHQGNVNPLNMDKEMLIRIIDGFVEHKTVTAKPVLLGTV
ncbi:SDR family oxidoreductase [Litchfieldia salsa]|uniref:Nucleoside-diphosphate-sugar epimerase n=1 Tax=Litchfieldia salsa TaxID=930152 RepID=A0A1H0W5K7_9BACI|nr:SDR family oxidoreductase [Litchfieldia salsa]SDP86032.1 Nucleoside-diphosphate-sugar epimerase [Litchfieldia salsa]